MPNPFLYIYIKYIGFGLFGFYGISTIVGYLMPNPYIYIYIYIYIFIYLFDIYTILSGFVWFNGISTTLMPNSLYNYILNMYDLFVFGFMAYQPL